MSLGYLIHFVLDPIPQKQALGYCLGTIIYKVILQ